MHVNMAYDPDKISQRTGNPLRRGTNTNKGNKFNGKLLSIAFVIFILVLVVLLVVTNLPKDNNINGNVEPTATPTPTPEPTVNPIITIDEPPVTEGGHFFEKSPKIDGQQAYIAYPTQIKRDAPPTIIIYSHGSITTITTDFTDDFMKDMREYGDFFTKNGYIFAASAMHGENWGSQASVNDMSSLIKWIADKYPANGKVNLVAHSMGGLPTIKFGMQNPDRVNKMALLAPTSYPTTYKKADIEKLFPVEIKIWHGDKDVNVPWSISNQFVNVSKNAGKTITFITLKGKTHWDVDTELKQEILDFYNEGTIETSPVGTATP